jgi:hypothetical protein
MGAALARPGAPSARLLNDFARSLIGAKDGGFGKPLRMLIPAPQALSRYCKQDPSGEDMVVLSYMLDAVLWTLRHETHHVWHPGSAPEWDTCPSREAIRDASAHEIAADKFAIDQIEQRSPDGFIAPWRDRVDQWTARYGGQKALDLPARFTALAFVIGHHEVDTILGQQAYLASQRVRKIIERVPEMPSRLADGLDLARATWAAKHCPGEALLKQQCARCSPSLGGCDQAIKMSWSCAFLDKDEKIVREQQRLQDELFTYLRARGFRVAEVEKNPHLTGYRIEREGSAPIIAGSLHGMPFPPDDEDMPTAGFCLGAARHIGGLILIADNCQGTEPVLTALWEWETNNYRKGCRSGDAHACRWLGLAHFKAHGTPLDLKAADLAYKKGCDGGVQEACTQRQNLRELLRSPSRHVPYVPAPSLRPSAAREIRAPG